MAGGASKWTEDYIRSLPTAPSVDSLGSTFKPDLGKVVRVDRKVYEWFGGGDGGGWEEVFTIPSDYSPEGAPPEETGGGTTSTGAPVMVPPLATPVSSSPVPSNPFYPMLVQEYDEPGLVDYSAYMPADSIFGYEQYQPATNPNNIPLSLFNYQPPTIYATDSRAGVGSLVTPGGVIEGGFMRPTIGIEAATSSTPSSSVPVGSGGYPAGDPRNLEDRGGPDRPDGYVGADTDTQTRADPTVMSLYPNQIGITPPPETSVYPNQIGITLPEEELAYAITTPLPPRPPVQVESAFSDLQADIAANKARQDMLADIRKAEAEAELAAAQAAVAKAASDHQVELAQAELAAAAQAAISAGLLAGGGGSAIGKQIGRYGQLESVGSVYGNPGGRGNDMGGWGGGKSGSGGSGGVGPGGVGGGVGKGY